MSNDVPAVVDIISDRLDRDRRGIRHPPIVRELAKACWFEAKGESGRAWQLVVEECRAGHLPELPTDPDLWPSRRAIERWANADGWHLQLAEHVHGTYPALMAAATARLVLQLPGSLDITARLTDSEYIPEKGDMLKLEAAKHVQTLAGLGTAGLQREGHVTINVQPRDALDISTMSPTELARHQRAQIEASRTQEPKK